MHSPAMLKQFSIAVRPATYQDMEALYKTMLDTWPAHKKDQAKPGSVRASLQTRGNPAYVEIEKLLPLLVFEYPGDYKSESLILLGNAPIEIAAIKGEQFGYKFFKLYQSYYGQPVTCNADEHYEIYLRQVKKDICRGLYNLDPANPDFGRWTAKWDKVAEALLSKGLDGIYPTKKEMNSFRRRARPFSSIHGERSFHRAAGYAFVEMVLARSADDSWSKKAGNGIFHKLVKDLIGHQFVISSVQRDDWWVYPSVFELVFV